MERHKPILDRLAESDGRYMKLTHDDVSRLESTLEAVGFSYYEKDGQKLWGEKSLGNGRTLLNAVLWAVGNFMDPTEAQEEREAAGRAASERIIELSREYSRVEGERDAAYKRINEAYAILGAPVKSLSGQVPIHPEQAEAMCRLLVDEGHMTPVATMQLRKLWTAEPA